MSEIAKCPICGEEPLCPPALNIEEMHPDSVECCGVVAFTKELWNQYAAAMELAKAEVVASNAACNVPLERLEAAVEAAEDTIFQAKMRVLEVFNGNNL